MPLLFGAESFCESGCFFISITRELGIVFCRCCTFLFRALEIFQWMCLQKRHYQKQETSWDFGVYEVLKLFLAVTNRSLVRFIKLGVCIPVGPGRSMSVWDPLENSNWDFSFGICWFFCNCDRIKRFIWNGRWISWVNSSCSEARSDIGGRPSFIPDGSRYCTISLHSNVPVSVLIPIQ